MELWHFSDFDKEFQNKRDGVSHTNSNIFNLISNLSTHTYHLRAQNKLYLERVKQFLCY